jgi:arsenate reductase (thioredoxin)
VKKSSEKKSVLFICTHNAVRSQMAEAFLNIIYGDRYTAFSAGTDPAQVDPLVIQVMKEAGIDISGYQSKSLDDFREKEFDYVITVCDQARESCPYFPGGHRRVHKSFADPSKFQGNDEDRINEYRRIRDDIKKWIEKEFK